MSNTEYNLADVRSFIESQLDLDMSRDGFLSIPEYREFMWQLVQVEIAESLKRIAARLTELCER